MFVVSSHFSGNPHGLSKNHNGFLASSELEICHIVPKLVPGSFQGLFGFRLAGGT